MQTHGDTSKNTAWNIWRCPAAQLNLKIPWKDPSTRRLCGRYGDETKNGQVFRLVSGVGDTGASCQRIAPR